MVLSTMHSICIAPNMSPVCNQSILTIHHQHSQPGLSEASDFGLNIWETFIEQLSHSMLDTFLGARDKRRSKPKIILTFMKL